MFVLPDMVEMRLRQTLNFWLLLLERLMYALVNEVVLQEEVLMHTRPDQVENLLRMRNILVMKNLVSFKIGYFRSYLILWSRALNNTVVKVLLKDKLSMLVL